MRSQVVEEPGRRRILGYHEVDTPIFIKIGQGRAALLPVNLDSGHLTGNGSQLSRRVCLQPESPTGIQPMHF
jgi:hypothetical protein